MIVVVAVAHIYPPVTGQRQTLTCWTIRTLFITGLLRDWRNPHLLRSFGDPMFLWISSSSCPLNLLLVRSHQAEIIIVKRLIQGRNNVARVRVEPRSLDQGRRKNDAFTHSAMLPTKVPSILLCRWYPAYCFADGTQHTALQIANAWTCQKHVERQAVGCFSQASSSIKFYTSSYSIAAHTNPKPLINLDQSVRMEKHKSKKSMKVKPQVYLFCLEPLCLVE